MEQLIINGIEVDKEISLAEMRDYLLEWFPNGIVEHITKFDEVYCVESILNCKFNVYNLLLAMCIAKQVGLTKTEILNGINNLSKIDGRMNLSSAFL